MRSSRVRDVWNGGGKVLNGWLGIPDSVASEAMTQADWDSLTIDLQHGLVHYDRALPMLQAISTSSITPLARVPWNEPGIIMKLLDSGCLGIICPMVSSGEECARFVGACRYPPAGYRSFGPSRATWYAGADYFAHANDAVLTFAMIETAGALTDLDAIMQTPGLDAVYVGPSDLALAIGEPPAGDPTSTPVLQEIERILTTAKRHGIRAGIHTSSPEGARRMFDMGFDLCTVLSDSALLVAAAKAAVAHSRGDVASAGASQTY